MEMKPKKACISEVELSSPLCCDSGESLSRELFSLLEFLADLD